MPSICQRFRQHIYASGCPVYCCYCAQPVPEEQATGEHVVPRSWGGRNNRSNLLIACAPCNLAVARDHLQTHGPSPLRRRRKRMGRRQKLRKLQAEIIGNRLRALIAELQSTSENKS